MAWPREKPMEGFFNEWLVLKKNNSFGFFQININSLLFAKEDP
jgi:hypothetical protein